MPLGYAKVKRPLLRKVSLAMNEEPDCHELKGKLTQIEAAQEALPDSPTAQFSNHDENLPPIHAAECVADLVRRLKDEAKQRLAGHGKMLICPPSVPPISPSFASADDQVQLTGYANLSRSIRDRSSLSVSSTPKPDEPDCMSFPTSPISRKPPVPRFAHPKNSFSHTAPCGWTKGSPWVPLRGLGFDSTDSRVLAVRAQKERVKEFSNKLREVNHESHRSKKGQTTDSVISRSQSIRERIKSYSTTLRERCMQSSNRSKMTEDKGIDSLDLLEASILSRLQKHDKGF